MPRCGKHHLMAMACLFLSAAIVQGLTLRGSRARASGTLVAVATADPDSLVQELNIARSGTNDTLKIAQTISMGLRAVMDGIKPFRQAPPDVRAGMDIFDKELWKIVEFLVPEDDLASEKMNSTKEVWDKMFLEVPDIYDDVHLFQSVGNTTALTKAVVEIVKLPISFTSIAFPDLSQYFDAILDMVEGLGETWLLFFEGNTTAGIETLWQATKKAVDEIAPPEWQEEQLYKNIMGVIDGVTSGLSKYVLAYKRLILESKVCYKNTIARGRVRPKVCRYGFVWDGSHSCIPYPENGADCWMPCGKKSGACPGFCGPDAVCCRKNYHYYDYLFTKAGAECYGAVGYIDHLFTKGGPADYHQCVFPAFRSQSFRDQQYGTYEAHCDMSSKWNEKHGEWCATSCPDGFYATSGGECRQICGGKFPADGWGTCGVNSTQLNKALLEMAGAALWGVVKLPLIISTFTEGGFVVTTFLETIRTFVDMGKSFARPMCPMPTGFKPEQPASDPVVFTVASAGDPRLNGEWRKVGLHRQRPTYQHVGNEAAIVEWSQSRMAWRMFIDDSWFGHGRTTLYRSNENTLTVPTSGWIVEHGPDPAPIVVMAQR